MCVCVGERVWVATLYCRATIASLGRACCTALHCTSLYFIVLPFALHAPQANDRVFKHELSKLVDLDVWTRAKEASKAELGSRQAGGCQV